jgi:hypothetical protein
MEDDSRAVHGAELLDPALPAVVEGTLGGFASDLAWWKEEMK